MKFDIIEVIIEKGRKADMDNAKTSENLRTVSHNLSSLQKKDTSVLERALAHTDEAARELAKLINTDDGLFENDEFFTAYRDFIKSASPSKLTPEDIPEKNQNRVSAIKNDDAVNPPIILCEAICKAKATAVNT